MIIKSSKLMLLAMTTTAMITAGCASGASQEVEKQEKKPQLDIDDEFDDGEDGERLGQQQGDEDALGSQKQGCEKYSSGFGLYAQGTKQIPGYKIRVKTSRNSEKVSLCDVLEKTGAKVAIFQFAGVECASCMDEAKLLSKKFANNDDIAHVVVITDFFKDYEDWEFKKFMNTYARGSELIFDEARLWKYFSEDSSLPNRATIMAMNTNLDATVYNKEGQSHKIVDAAKKLLRKVED